MHSVNDRAPRPLVDASASRAGVSASLTYEPFYGLGEKPFSLSPDPRFLYRSPAHGPAFDELQAGIRRREGLIVLTGEIGTGKTTLCRSVLKHLDRRTFSSFVADPFVSREDLLKALLVDFGVISIGDLTRGRFDGASRSDLSYPLYEFLDSLVPLQAFAVLVIDEAQNLSLPLLEEIRILSELERREKLLQVVLVGQPELRSSLRLPQMRQVEQRVSVRCELAPLDAAGVAGYVKHRLDVAGRGESRAAFTAPALEAVYEGSLGVPRLINRICDRALQRACASQSLQVDAPFVWTAIEDLDLSAVAEIHDQPCRETAANRNPAPSRSETPAEIAAEIGSLTAAANQPPSTTGLSSGLAEFPAEGDLPAPAGESAGRSGMPRRWVVAAAAVIFAISASVATGSWYTDAGQVDGPAISALVPPAPVFTLPGAEPLPADPASPRAAGAMQAVSSKSAVPSQAPGALERHGYSILVASFESRERAERLVAELTAAGFEANAVERIGGAAQSRFTLVKVGGYTSVADVERDLQRIRELPGGYRDARIEGLIRRP
jgi:type II secretory pathway predicted ATPase ExeA/cell division septation protein DedD